MTASDKRQLSRKLKPARVRPLGGRTRALAAPQRTAFLNAKRQLGTPCGLTRLPTYVVVLALVILLFVGLLTQLVRVLATQLG